MKGTRMAQDGAQVAKRKIGAFGYAVQIPRISWRDLAAALWPVLLITAVAIWIAFHFVRPAPPGTITITSGIEGSTFRAAAEKYQKILARNGVKLEILPSAGALENLKRLSDPQFKVDFVLLLGDAASPAIMRKLIRTPGIRLMDFAQPTPEQNADLRKRLDEIEQRVNSIKMPLPFADQFYVLREHINFVRRRLAASAGESDGRQPS